MTKDDEAANPSWDPFGLWREWSRATGKRWEATKLAPGLPAATSPLQWMLDVGRTRFVGRRVSLSLAGAQIEFDLEDITLVTDPIGLQAGQADEVALAATDVVWGAHRFPAARATFHNVHTRPGKDAALVSAPIDLHLRVSARDIATRVEARAPWLRVEITDSGELRARYRKRPGWGWISFDLAPRGHAIAAILQTLTVAGRTWRLPSRLRPILIPLTLPADVSLKAVLAMPGSLELSIRLDERRVDITSVTSLLSRRKPRTSED